MNETTCLCCLDDYGDLADECIKAGLCEDCNSSYTTDEILQKVMENQNEKI